MGITLARPAIGGIISLTSIQRMIRAMQKQLTLEEVDRLEKSVKTFAISVVDRVLDRALRNARLDAHYAAQRALSGGSFARSTGRSARLSKVIVRALKSHYTQIAVPPSVRLTMPGGGVSFHFDHVSVSARSMALQKGERRNGVNKWHKQPYARDIRWTSRASAHQIYIERPSARDEIEEWDAARAQRYIEDADKVALNGGKGNDDFSFGNIGQTLRERTEFWELACKGAERENGIIQHRFIVQLPKEASALERKAIMEAFVAPFQKEGMRFWVALHAPTADNDPRNFHAHVVMYHRPARKVLWSDPASGSDTPVRIWDFACARREKTKCRRWKVIFPERQKVPDWMRGPFVLKQRRRFADCVNEVMSAAGKGHVKYDPRSYEEAGIKATPEKKAKYASKVDRHDRDHTIDELVGDLATKNHSESRRIHEGEWDILSELEARLAAGLPVSVASLHEATRIPMTVTGSNISGQVGPEARSAAETYAKARLDQLHSREQADLEIGILDTAASATAPDAVRRHRARLKAQLSQGSPQARERTRTAHSEVADDAEAEALHDAAMRERETRRRQFDRELATREAETRFALDRLLMSLRREQRQRNRQNASIAPMQVRSSPEQRAASRAESPSAAAVSAEPIRRPTTAPAPRGKGYGD